MFTDMLRRLTNCRIIIIITSYPDIFLRPLGVPPVPSMLSMD